MSGSPYFCPPFFASASCQPLYYPYPASSYGPSVSLVPPPPTFSFFPPPTAQRGSTTPFTPSVIAIIGILGAAFLLVSYYTIVAKYCTSRGLFRRQRGSRDAREDAGPNDAAWPMLTRGLEESVIKIIPVCKYAKGDGLIEGTECAVCLSEFEEDEALRLLPKCSHAFHLPCIDKWLQSHSNCPLCRANIMSPIPVPTPAQQSLSAAVEDVAPNNSSQPQPVNGSLEEQEGHSERSNRHLPDQAPEDRDSTQAVATGQAFTDPGTEGETGNHSDNQTKALEMLQREEKISGRYSDGLYAAERVLYFAQMRSFSAGIAMSDSQESRPNHSDSKVQGGWREKAGSSNPSYFTRSYSTGSFSRNAVVELQSNQEWEQRCMNTARSGKAALPVYEMQALLTLKDSNCGSSEDAAPAGLHVVVDVAGATGSSSRQIATDDSKSKSFRHESGLKNKADVAGGGDPLMGKMLQSLSKGPFGMRRSFSSGRRIFAFMNSRGRNTAEFENNAESLA